MDIWYKNPEVDNSIIISSRIRLARNLRKYRFTSSFTQTDAKNIINDIKEIILERSLYIANNLEFSELDSIDVDCLNYYSERHSISRFMVESEHNRAFFKDLSENLSIMINEEDHIRIQNIGAGEDLDDCYSMANKIDDLLSENLEYAYDHDFGYLTACPTNVGTGIRASYMLHLPVMEHSGSLKEHSEIITKAGFTLRGAYGEGSASLGSIYQLSNQLTLGYSEEEILGFLKQLTNKIVEKENSLRKTLVSTMPLELQDRVHRAYGLLSHARKMNLDEAMRLLSHIRVGQHLGYIAPISKSRTLYNIMIDIQPYSLQFLTEKAASPEHLDILRAEYLRNCFKR